jgi:hypothetical protein
VLFSDVKISASFQDVPEPEMSTVIRNIFGRFTALSGLARGCGNKRAGFEVGGEEAIGEDPPSDEYEVCGC